MTTGVYLDTSFLIRSVRRGSGEAESLSTWLQEGRPVMISALAWAEFLCGPVTDDQKALTLQVVGEPRPIAVREAELAAQLYNDTGRRRGSLADCVIAAAAIEGGAPLATSDGSFARFTDFGLTIAS